MCTLCVGRLIADRGQTDGVSPPPPSPLCAVGGGAARPLYLHHDLHGEVTEDERESHDTTLSGWAFGRQGALARHYFEKL